MASRTRDVDGAGVSSDSTTIGVPSCGSVGLLRKCLLKTQGFIGALVSGNSCHDDWRVEERPGLVVTHAKRSSRRPWVHVDSRGLHALKPNMTRSCSRSRRRSRQAGGIGDVGPCNDTLVPDQSIRRHRLLAPTHPRKPSGSCHHMGSRWASSGVSIWPSSLHTTKRRYSRPKEHKEQSRTNNMQSVSMRVQDVAGPYVGSK